MAKNNGVDLGGALRPGAFGAFKLQVHFAV